MLKLTYRQSQQTTHERIVNIKHCDEWVVICKYRARHGVLKGICSGLEEALKNGLVACVRWKEGMGTWVGGGGDRWRGEGKGWCPSVYMYTARLLQIGGTSLTQVAEKRHVLLTTAGHRETEKQSHGETVRRRGRARQDRGQQRE